MSEIKKRTISQKAQKHWGMDTNAAFMDEQKRKKDQKRSKTGMTSGSQLPRNVKLRRAI